MSDPAAIQRVIDVIDIELRSACNDHLRYEAQVLRQSNPAYVGLSSFDPAELEATIQRLRTEKTYWRTKLAAVMP